MIGSLRRPLLEILLVALVPACEEQPPPLREGPREPLPQIGSRFDPQTVGTIHGRVSWAGIAPVLPDYVTPPLTLAAEGLHGERRWNNPNAPLLARDGGLGNAVVFLHGVDPARSRPWDREPVQVEQVDFQFQIRQGEELARYGIVRRGDAIRMVSRQKVFHSLHADGAAFFTLAFPDADRPLTRCLPERGVVELTSAAGYFWMRAYLFVDDHPYYAATDGSGQFSLRDVPPGTYEVVCWLPNWLEQGRTRDPETGLVNRLALRPPVKVGRRIVVTPGGCQEVNFELSENDVKP